jgi:hypothetical protein
VYGDYRMVRRSRIGLLYSNSTSDSLSGV